MNRRILSATLFAFAIATIATLWPQLLRAQAQSNQVLVPRVLDLSYSDVMGAPVPPAALSQVAPPDAAEDAKTTARRFAQGTIPAIAGTDMSLTDWAPVSFVADDDGVTHTRLQQTIGGLRVFGAQVAVHLNGFNIVGLNGEALIDIDTSLKPDVTLEAAAKAARVSLGLDERLQVESGELVIYNPAIIDQGPSANYLAYYVVLSNAARDESYSALVDARAAKLLNSYNNIESARNRITYDLTNRTSPLPGTQCHGESAPVNGASPSADCLSAHRFAGETYDYFNATHGRDSWDGAGASMVTSIRYGTVANAFWNGRQSAYGPGFATKDVVAHEWTHAIVGSSARLIYQNQSGALNESMADIFAAMIDNDDWLLGEDTPIGALRSLENPPAYRDPDRVGSSLFYCGTADNGGVHTNSGVPNKAAYLMAAGGTFNSRTVTAIGRDATAKIFYRALTRHLTAGSNFIDAVTALQTSCTELAATSGSGITSNTCTQVTNALQAVEMNVAACATTGGTITPDTFEDDDAPTATSVTGRLVSSNPEQHTFHDAGDADWVRFAATAGATMRFETSGLQSNADTILRLYGTNGTSVLAEDDDSGGGTCPGTDCLASRIDYTFTTGGNYFLRAVQFNRAVFGDSTGYTLRVSTTTSTGGDSYEDDDSITQTREIAAGEVHVGHTYGDAGDNDWKRFTATANTTYIITTENLFVSSDTYLFLYRLDGSTPVLLAADDDGGPGLASRIEFTPSVAGTYYVRSRHYTNGVFGPNTGYDFRLATTTTSVADQFEPDDIASQARPITLDTVQQHNSHVPSDFDWVQFSATGGTTYTFQTTIASGSRSDTILDLYTSAGNLIASNDDSAGTLQSTIVHRPAASGTLLARVRQFNPGVYGSAATYGLRVTSTSCSGADSHEPNDSIGTATPYTAGSIQSHNHACAGDVDFISFSASRNMDYDIRTLGLGASADTVMSLLNSTGAVLAVNDDGGGGLASRIAFRAPSDGTFYLAIRHYSPSANGPNTNYQFTIASTGTSGTADSFENDDTQASARAITIGSPHSNHNFHAAGDSDWISFSATGGTNYVVETFNLGSFSDTIVEVYSGTTLLGRDDDGGGGLASRVAFSVTATGSVHFRVFHFNSSTFGSNTNYDVRVGAAISTTTGDAFEPDNSVAEANANNRVLTTSTAQVHNFHAASDHDWTKFTAVANTTYTIFTANLASSSDTILDLYQSDGTTLIASNDDGGGGLASRIQHTATAAGDLYVRVRHYSPSVTGAGTQYELRLAATAATAGDSYEPDNSSGTARSITVGTTGAPNHNFSFGGDQDWHSFSATSGSMYTLETLNLGVRSDTVIDLIDTDGTSVLRRNDDFNGLASRIDFAAPATGTYFVRITHYSSSVSGNDTNYDFRITVAAACTTGDSFEPDSTPGQARDLAVGATQTGRTTGCAGDHDWIRLTGLAGGSRYVIETFDLGSTADTFLTLYNGTGGTVLAENDDFSGLASRIEFGVATGDTDRLVRVRHFSSGASGATTSYSIRLTNLSTATQDTHEPDDTFQQAKILTTTAQHTGSTAHNFHVAGDVDWISVAAPSSQTCIFETFGLGSRSDTVVRLIGPDGTTQLAFDDDGAGVGFASRISYAFQTGGTHYLKIQHYSSSTGGADTGYSVRFSCAAATTDEFEPDNNFSQAREITVNGAVQRKIHDPAGDQDWSRFTATSGTSYVLETIDLAGGDTYLFLYGTDGTTLLRQDDDSGPGLASYLVWTAPANGTYYVMVRQFSSSRAGSDTAYSLRVRTGTADTQPRVEVTSQRGPTPGTVQLIVRPLTAADEMKIEVQAKPELLAFTGARSLVTGKDGSVQPVRMFQSTVDEPGMTAMYLEGKQLETPIDANGVVAIDYQLVRPLPNRKTSVQVRATTIDAAGNVHVDIVETTVNSIDGSPRVESFSPGTMEESGATRVVEVRGANFDRPKAFLLAGGSELAMLDVTYRDDGTWLEFVVPGGLRAGTYGVRVRNNDNTAADAASALVVGAACDFTVSRETLTVSGSGGTESVTVSTGTGCQWTPQSQAAWVRVTTPTDSMSGSGTMSVAVDPAPAAGRPNGMITVVAGGSATGARTITVVQPANSNPVFSSIGNQNGTVNQALGPIAFSVTDDDDATVTITASSSNTSVIPNGSIVIANAGAHRLAADSIFAVLNRTITITPAATGQATITLNADDGRGGTASTTFVVTVSQGPVLQPPTGVRATADGTMISVQWTAPASGLTPTGYRVEAGRSSGAADVNMDVGVTDRVTLNVTATGTWFVRVKSLRNSEVSAASNEVQLIIGTLGAPRSFAASVAGNTVTLTWVAPASGVPDGYILQAGTGTGLSNLGEFPLGNTLSFVAPGVPNGTYFLRMIAATAAGVRGGASNEVRVDVGGGPVEVPGAPQSAAGSASGNLVTLTWAAPAAGGTPTTYLLDAGTASGLSNLASGVAVGNVLSFSATVPDGRYFIRVRAANSAGAGAASNEIVVTVGNTQAPGAPSALTRNVSGNTVTLSWTAPSTGGPVATYVIDAGTGPGLSNIAQAAVGNATTLSATVPSGRYFVRVRAVNNIGSSPASNEVIVDVP